MSAYIKTSKYRWHFENVDILNAENIELRDKNKDILEKFSALEKQAQSTSIQSSNITKEHIKCKKELEKYKSIVDKFNYNS